VHSSDGRDGSSESLPTSSPAEIGALSDGRDGDRRDGGSPDGDGRDGFSRDGHRRDGGSPDGDGRDGHSRDGSIPTSSRSETGAISSAISRNIVRLHAQLYGRGPTKAKTYLDEDYALCVLQEIFTPGEKTLIETGYENQVEATRHAFQDAVEKQFVEAVESSTGRVVKAFFSQIHIGSDSAAELFLFERQAE
jgi:uncharacterized protein YbcI